MTNIHKKVMAIRHLRRYSQEEIARLSHISFRTYQRIESGSCSTRLGHLENLAIGFQCSVEDILFFDLEHNCFPEKMGRTQALEHELALLQEEVGLLRQVVQMLRRGGGD